MIPTEILKNEHKVILMVLELAEKEIASIQNTRKINAEKIEKMVDFFKNFADTYHHAKEEKHLFVKMNATGVPTDSGPIAVMLKEHEEARKMVKSVAQAIQAAKIGSSTAIRAIKENLSSYIELLRSHIKKEDFILYSLADNLFTEEDQKALLEEFEEVQAKEIGEGFYEKYNQLAHELAN